MNVLCYIPSFFKIFSGLSRSPSSSLRRPTLGLKLAAIRDWARDAFGLCRNRWTDLKIHPCRSNQQKWSIFRWGQRVRSGGIGIIQLWASWTSVLSFKQMVRVLALLRRLRCVAGVVFPVPVLFIFLICWSSVFGCRFSLFQRRVSPVKLFSSWNGSIIVTLGVWRSASPLLSASILTFSRISPLVSFIFQRASLAAS